MNDWECRFSTLLGAAGAAAELESLGYTVEWDDITVHVVSSEEPSDELLGRFVEQYGMTSAGGIARRPKPSRRRRGGA